MFDRSMLRDAAFAVLLGLPTLALARPQANPTPESAPVAQPLVEQAALADQGTVERRFAVPEEGDA